LPLALKEKLQDQGYHIIGNRGAFKACQWQKKSLLHDEVCYKQRFYGIESHRCLQMTPVVDKCTHSCAFCWRITPRDVDFTWSQTTVQDDVVESVEDLLEGVLSANMRSLGGYNPEINHSVSSKKYDEARNPKHVAISLAGEPTLYPLLNELIEEIQRRNMTSFVVSNGTRPSIVERLTMPTQLYITLPAPDYEIYSKLCRPNEKLGWENLNRTLEILPSLSGRRVIRLTMVAGMNMYNPRSYAKIIERSEVDFVEVKGYMHIGSSRNRLTRSHAPSHREIMAFAKKLSHLTGYAVDDEQRTSRVVLLSRSKNIKKKIM
jgi:tRNA wybutosine-synthesizing protein 1